MVSVIIAAHNEEAVIGRCLDALRSGLPEGTDVVVAANGCHDQTAKRASEHQSHPRVVTLARPNKVAALNAADLVARTFPRIYLDADVVLEGSIAGILAIELESRVSAAAGAPNIEIDLHGCSRRVRAFYRVWLALPVRQDGYVGSGVYAVNEAGHKRIFPLPNLIADDEFVRRQFASSERVLIEGRFTMFPARTVRSLIRRSVRVREGNAQLRRAGVRERKTAMSLDRPSTISFLLAHVRDRSAGPDRLLGVTVFVAVAACSRLGSAVRARSGSSSAWLRDDSSRT